jgi:hypothetical protein
MYTFTFRLFSFLIGSVLYLSMAPPLQAQCVIDSLVPNVPGIYPDTLADAVGCEYYETDVTFFLPRDTTVEVFGSEITLPFLFFRIDSISGLPDGLDWDCNLNPDCIYNVADTTANPDTLGCVKVFGTPTQAGIFPVVVHLTAEVDILGTPTEQPSTFESEILVSPCPFVGDCYTYTLTNLCAGAELALTNNVPSGGSPAYTYSWSISGPNNYSFQSTTEDPTPQILPDAGTYILQYDGVIDTFGYTLTNISIDSVDCADPVGGAPDLYWILKDPNGQDLVNTSASPVNNATLPLNTNIGSIVLDTGTYELQVWDDDLISADDECTGSGASLLFSIPTIGGGTHIVNAGGLYVSITIDHPVSTPSCTDTITLDTLPPMPEIMLMADTAVLCDSDTLSLMVVTNDSIQWFLDGAAIDDATSMVLEVSEIGDYTVETFNPNTFCTALSAPLTITPQSISPPNISFDGDFTLNVDATGPNLRYDWYEIANGFEDSGDSIQPAASGNYFAIATDTTTGCQSVSSDTLNIILSSLESLREWVGDVRLFPNPSQGHFEIQIELLQSQHVDIQILDLSGRLVWTQAYGRQYGRFAQPIDLQQEARGLYFLQVRLDAGVIHQKLVLR